MSMTSTRTRNRKYFGFSKTGKLHKIHQYHQQRDGRYASRYPPSHCQTTSLVNLQNDDLVIENHDFCRICFKDIAKDNPKTLKQILRKNDSDRMSWLSRMGLDVMIK